MTTEADWESVRDHRARTALKPCEVVTCAFAVVMGTFQLLVMTAIVLIGSPFALLGAIGTFIAGLSREGIAEAYETLTRAMRTLGGLEEFE